MSRAEKQPLFDECGPFAVVPKWLLLTPGLTDRALRLYLVLWTYTTDGNRFAFPSRRTIGAQMGCAKKKVDQAVTELIAAGGLTITPQYRSGTGERTSNLYELILTQRTETWCLGCGHTREVGCKCSSPGHHLDATWGAFGYHGGLQMDTAGEEEPFDVEPPKESHLSLSSDSQASSLREAKVRSARKLPFDADIILELMRQMSYECYAKHLSEITDTNFAAIRKATLEIAGSMRRSDMPPDPAYVHGFAQDYRIRFPDFHHPAPISYAKYWDDVDWSDQSLREYMDWWREAEANEPERPHVMNRRGSGYLAL
jgi:hypothetical protein